ncbi:BLUF domain-containing protein [Hydrogenophaga sp.]|uniref:BLUF domain-containing protein n=1 Tax=Hydrogenophaga sp. TaxID=1904254 RepID=UPI0027322992|nr:BLUF domain-containing protein [Hydrogenophaga sp.]MDP1685390.1 BLUF domain-containing protein [Hydrogenophaga sp.]
MTRSSSIHSSHSVHFDLAADDAAPALATLVYRSRCVTPLDDSALQQLVDAALKRNQAESVTGLLIYDSGRFLQWLEGPAEGVNRIWQSIRADGRHTDVEILGHMPSTVRCFPDWGMKLGDRDTSERPHAANDAHMSPPHNLLDLLRSQQGVPHALPTDLWQRAPAHPEFDHEFARLDHEILKRVVDSTVLPQVAPRYGSGEALHIEHHRDPRMASLARLLVAADPAEAFALLDILHAEAGSLRASCMWVSEPAARDLGDLWASDEVSEFDVTLGLGRLQQSFRKLCLEADHNDRPLERMQGRILIAPLPGEQHLMGAVFDAEMMWREGWDTRCEFPEDTATLVRLVKREWFDVVDLSLSLAFNREDWMPRMAATIAAVRGASLNPALTVVVRGRVFFDHDEPLPELIHSVGADGASTAAVLVVPSFQRSASGG